MCSSTSTGDDGQSSTKDNEDSPVYYTANVEILCTLTPGKTEEWKMNTYRHIIQAYKKQKADYYQQLTGQQEKILSPNPKANREIEKHHLTGECKGLLRERVLEAMGNPQPGQVNVFQQQLNQAGYSRFFQDSLEWNEMTYQFYPGCQEIDNDLNQLLRIVDMRIAADNVFSTFLRAQSARVLLPVTPGLTRMFLYFLATGMIWPGTEECVPVTQEFLPIVNEWKAIPGESRDPGPDGEPWEISIPTTMRILQEGSHLPGIEAGDSVE
jgi:hypothetical protein